MDEDYISLCGPVELEGNRLVLRIPLAAGGDQLRLVSAGISEIDGDDLVVIIPGWLAEKIQIGEGTMVCVDDRWGKFNITKEPVQ